MPLLSCWGGERGVPPMMPPCLSCTTEKAGTDKGSASEGCKGAGEHEAHERPGSYGND